MVHEPLSYAYDFNYDEAYGSHLKQSCLKHIISSS